MPENKRLAYYLGIQTNQILKNDDEVCIPRLFRILLAVPTYSWRGAQQPKIGADELQLSVF